MRKLSCIVYIMCIIVCLCGCGAKTAITDEQAGINVTVYETYLTEIEDNVSYTGEIKADEETSVSAKATGTAKGINAEIGDFVNAGDVLLVIDDTDYRLQYNQAKAAYNSALAAYNLSSIQAGTTVESAKLELDNATKNYERMETLFNMGAISQVEFDGAKTRLTTAQLNMDTAQKNYDLTINSTGAEVSSSVQAAIASAKASLDIAQNSLNNTIVRAPISGYISSKNVNLGQMIAAGNPIFTIKNTDLVNAEINVTESIIPYINVGTEAKISISSANIDNITGTVTVVNQVKNPQTGMYTVRISIENNKNVLKDGMFADVSLMTQKAEAAIVVPQEAVMQDVRELYVYVTDGKIAEKRVVTTGISNDEFTQVLSGVSEGELVIVSGKEYISEKNNMVNIVE